MQVLSLEEEILGVLGMTGLRLSRGGRRHRAGWNGQRPPHIKRFLKTSSDAKKKVEKEMAASTFASFTATKNGRHAEDKPNN
jgi:hypothetical protein